MASIYLLKRLAKPDHFVLGGENLLIKKFLLTERLHISFQGEG